MNLLGDSQTTLTEQDPQTRVIRPYVGWFITQGQDLSPDPKPSHKKRQTKKRQLDKANDANASLPPHKKSAS